MSKVEIYKLNNDGTQKTVVVCSLEDDKIVCRGEAENLIGILEKTGITDYSSKEQKTLFPKDGLKFLEQLQYNFKSGYLNASKVFNN
ncbi:MAG: hypothetical protein U9P90_02405 [Patescibacteria group bacterium]|nr:hypothetical protein [Patescibacteria group bacterium]